MLDMNILYIKISLLQLAFTILIIFSGIQELLLASENSPQLLLSMSDTRDKAHLHGNNVQFPGRICFAFPIICPPILALSYAEYLVGIRSAGGKTLVPATGRLHSPCNILML